MFQINNPQCQNVHFENEIAPRRNERQNANVSNQVNSNLMYRDEVNTSSHGNKNVRKRTLTQMNESQDLDDLEENCLIPVRKKRALHQNAFTENENILVQINQPKESLNFPPIHKNSQNQNNRILPPSESYGCLVPVDKSKSTRQTVPDNQLSLMAGNNRSLPQNELTSREISIPEKYSCLRFPQICQSQISANGVQPQVNLSQSSSLPFFGGKSAELNSEISSEEDMEIDNTEIPQNEMYTCTQQNTFIEKVDYHHFSRTSQIGHLNRGVVFQQQMSHWVNANHSQGTKENNIESRSFNGWAAGNRETKNSTGFRNWPAMNTDESESMDWTADNPRQAVEISSMYSGERASAMDWSSDGLYQANEFPKVNCGKKVTVEFVKEISHYRVNLENGTSALKQQKLSCKIKIVRTKR